MGSKYPVLKPDEIMCVLRKHGFEIISQRGSHIKMRAYSPTTRTVIIPNHYEIAKGTLQAILVQAGMSLDELLHDLPGQ